MKAELSEKQRRALEHLERARAEGLRLSAYARVHGLGIREIYDALAALRNKGVLPRPSSRSKSAFLAVRVKPAPAQAAPMPVAPTGALICRLRIGASVIECAQWPPPAWVVALSSGPADASA